MKQKEFNKNYIIDFYNIYNINYNINLHKIYSVLHNSS